MTFYELYKALDERFPKELSCEWDNDGIMCADDLNKPVKKVLISLDVTDESVEYARKNGFDTIISHHPLVFKAQKALNSLNFTQNKLILLVKSGIRVMSFHTRLDAADGGVNDALAELLGFSSSKKDCLEPIGRICELNEQMPISAFIENVKSRLNAPFVSYIGERPVKTVYLAGGDGKDMISRAVECGADTLLTGNASYNSMLDADEMGINVIEAGHFYTENPVCRKLQTYVNQLDCKIETELFESNKIKNL